MLSTIHLCACPSPTHGEQVKRVPSSRGLLFTNSGWLPTVQRLVDRSEPLPRCGQSEFGHVFFVFSVVSAYASACLFFVWLQREPVWVHEQKFLFHGGSLLGCMLSSVPWQMQGTPIVYCYFVLCECLFQQVCYVSVSMIKFSFCFCFFVKASKLGFLMIKA